MSFLDQYLNKHRLEKLPEKAKKKLAKLETHLASKINNNSTPKSFEDCIVRLGPRLGDLIERVSLHFDSFEWSVSGVLAAFRFVNSISIEVFQIVEEIKDCVVTDGMSEAEQHKAKVDFGKDLVWFIWMTVDPLKGRLTWIPFKRTIEKKVVLWLAGMALESTVDLFNANEGVASFGVETRVVKKGKIKTTKVFVKALP